MRLRLSRPCAIGGEQAQMIHSHRQRESNKMTALERGGIRIAISMELSNAINSPQPPPQMEIGTADVMLSSVRVLKACAASPHPESAEPSPYISSKSFGREGKSPGMEQAEI